MANLTFEEKLDIAKRIRRCDGLFDGVYNRQSGYTVRDRKTAYLMMRDLALELKEKLDA